jgi:hypothetical protein
VQIFVAHSASSEAISLAASIAYWLNDHGHTAKHGDDFTRNEKGFPTFNRSSISRHEIRSFFERSEALVAVFLDTSEDSQNVAFEMGYYLRQAKPERIIVVAPPERDLPPFMTTAHVIRYSPETKRRFFGEFKHAIDAIDALFRRSRRQVFLSYAKEDSDQVRELYDNLADAGYNIWYDLKKLVVGDDWDLKIVRAIQESVAFIACFSELSVSKRGYFNKELRRSLEVAEEFPEGAIYILPVKLGPCEVPPLFNKYHWCNLYEENGLEQLFKALDVAVYGSE